MVNIYIKITLKLVRNKLLNNISPRGFSNVHTRRVYTKEVREPLRGPEKSFNTKVYPDKSLKNISTGGKIFTRGNFSNDKMILSVNRIRAMMYNGILVIAKQ